MTLGIAAPFKFLESTADDLACRAKFPRRLVMSP